MRMALFTAELQEIRVGMHSRGYRTSPRSDQTDSGSIGVPGSILFTDGMRRYVGRLGA